MPAKIRNEPGSILFFATLLLMTVSLFVSRATLSVSIVLFVVTSFCHKRWPEHTRNYFSSPLHWVFGLLWLVPLISGLWSTADTEFISRMQVKLPLLFLPFAFASPLIISAKQWRLIAATLVLLVTAGATWSVIVFLDDPVRVNETYLSAKSIVTPLDNDRVRFSWLVAICAILSGFLGYRNRTSKPVSFLFALAAIALVLYLHLLAIRTGLLTFYILVFLLLLQWIRRKFKRWPVLLILIAIPFVSYFIFPSFQNRLRYLRYEMDFARHGSYLPGSTDPVRIISIRAGLDQFTGRPLGGTGFGDLRNDVQAWYHENIPDMQESDMILPSSEFVLYASGAGIAGLLTILAAAIIPFLIKQRRRTAWQPVAIASIILLLFDIPLEVQYGAFLYTFILFGALKWLQTENG